MVQKKETEHNIRLTSTEVASLFATYMNDSMSQCVYTRLSGEIALFAEDTANIMIKHG